MKRSIELDREDDGRWIAEISEPPGVMAHGAEPGQAVGAVERLAMEAVADRVANRELPESSFNLVFRFQYGSKTLASLYGLWPNRTHESNLFKQLLCRMGLHRWCRLDLDGGRSTLRCSFCRSCRSLTVLN